jgi:alpha-tubulin suppressor-like RCC1 family protein
VPGTAGLCDWAREKRHSGQLNYALVSWTYPMIRKWPPLGVVTLVAAIAACSDSTGPQPAAAPLGLAVGGQHACHSTETATRCWGKGTDGQLGIGATSVGSAPTTVEGTPPFASLVAGSIHTCGLDLEGNAYCWGSNRDGQLGTADQLEGCPLPCATTARRVASDLRFATLAAGTDHTCGITLDGDAYCWGLNDIGQLGTTSANESCVDGPCSRVPLKVQTEKKFTVLTAALHHTCALDNGGAAFCWGFQLGTSEKVHVHPEFSPDVKPLPGGLKFQQISAGGLHTCAVTANGVAYCWGLDAIGAGPSPLESQVPVQVAGNHRFSSVYSAGHASCGLVDDGIAYCWGPNTHGEIGTGPVGSTVRFNVPTPVSGGLRFTALSGGSSTFCGITTSEAVACWGRGVSGELGSGEEDSTQPVAVP